MTAVSAGAPAESGTQLSIRPLLYPGERWRFAVATIASALLVGGVLAILASRGVATLVAGVVIMALAGASVWWAVQLIHARLFGNAVKVTPQSFPEIQQILDEVLSQLDFRRRVQVYVTSKSDPPVALVSYLGTHIIVIEGGLVHELMEAGAMDQLRFLIARHIGAIKAKHYRLDVLIVMLSAANALQVLKPFLLPYYRATQYSGDQIGLACCGSLESALEATGRLLVGKELAPALPFGGVLPQAALVKRRLMPRFVQFLSPTPHVMNRYQNLLMYGRRQGSEVVTRMAAEIDVDAALAFEHLWAASPHRNESGLAPAYEPVGPGGLPAWPPPTPTGQRMEPSAGANAFRPPTVTAGLDAWPAPDIATATPSARSGSASAAPGGPVGLDFPPPSVPSNRVEH